MDQSQENLSSSAGLTSSTLTHRRMAVHFEQAIISGLSASGELSKDWSGFGQAGQGSRNSTDTARSIRFTATPTPAVVINADSYSRDSSQESSGVLTVGNSSGSTISMRSEIMPGLSLGLTKARNLRTDMDRASSSDNFSGNISAILAPDVLLSVSRSRISQSSEPVSLSSKSETTVATLRMPTGMGLDLTLDAGNSKSSGNLGTSFDSQSIGASVRGSLSSDFNVGLGLRRNAYSTSGLSVNKQTTNSLDFDMSWLVSGSVGIDARMNYYLNRGTNVSEYISPSVDFRWTPNSLSSLYLHYNFSQSRQWDALRVQFVSQGDRGLGVGLTQKLTEESSLDVTYDFQGSNFGTPTWQRSLRILFNHRL
jgi:hypothetical protein